MKKHIPNFLTCLNATCGAIGIMFIALSPGHSFGLGPMLFVILGLCLFFDLMDGAVARKLKVDSKIGLQLDSLADVISFGLFPSIVICAALKGIRYDHDYLNPSPELVKETYWFLTGLLIVPFSALRLAKFNVANDQTSEFKGLPTPANAIMLMVLVVPVQGINNFIFINNPYLIIGVVVISCFLLVSNIRMIAFKFKSMSWAGNELRYLLLVILIIGFAVFQLSFVPFVIPTYIVFSIVGNYLLQPVVFR